MRSFGVGVYFDSIADSYVSAVWEKVTVVAQVMSIQAQQMNSVVYVDDGTGRIEARLWSGPDNESELEQYGSL